MCQCLPLARQNQMTHHPGFLVVGRSPFRLDSTYSMVLTPLPEAACRQDGQQQRRLWEKTRESKYMWTRLLSRFVGYKRKIPIHFIQRNNFATQIELRPETVSCESFRAMAGMIDLSSSMK